MLLLVQIARPKNRPVINSALPSIEPRLSRCRFAFTHLSSTEPNGTRHEILRMNADYLTIA